MHDRAWRSEPAGRRVRERQAATGRRAAENRGARASGSETVRHIATIEGQSRMRQQDPGQVRGEGVCGVRVEGVCERDSALLTFIKIKYIFGLSTLCMVASKVAGQIFNTTNLLADRFCCTLKDPD